MREKNICIALFFQVFLSLLLSATPIERVFVKGGYFKYSGKKIIVSSFDMSKCEITNQSYAAFLNAKQIRADGVLKGNVLISVGSADLQLEFRNNLWQAMPGYNDFPVVMVSYYGAVEFCSWAGGKLPTEAEWLYAAGGGEKSKHYLFSGADKYEKIGWFKENSGRRLHSVGKKSPNELGIYDMSGNAWEWCLHNSPVSDSSFCLHMGGSWYAGELAGRLDARYGNTPTHFSNSIGFRVVFPEDLLSGNKNFFKTYKGMPWNSKAQQIPGRIQCEWYDSGGERVAYHDQDTVNNGSGRLNPADGSFLNEFRMNEGVDISYTKGKAIDNNPYNLVEPVLAELYAGWTVPGEWINYTVKITEAGTFSIGLMYTASGDGGIELLLDGKKITGELRIPSTRNDQEAVAWRQWHHWNKIDNLATIKPGRGVHVLTLKTVTNGNMNYDYLEFKRLE